MGSQTAMSCLFDAKIKRTLMQSGFGHYCKIGWLDCGAFYRYQTPNSTGVLGCSPQGWPFATLSKLCLLHCPFELCKKHLALGSLVIRFKTWETKSWKAVSKSFLFTAMVKMWETGSMLRITPRLSTWFRSRACLASATISADTTRSRTLRL